MARGADNGGWYALLPRTPTAAMEEEVFVRHGGPACEKFIGDALSWPPSGVPDNGRRDATDVDLVIAHAVLMEALPPPG